MLRQRSEKEAFDCLEGMLQATVINLNLEISLSAAKLGLTHKLLLADSIIFATGLAYDAIIWTQDVGFQGLLNVRYQKKEYVDLVS